MMHKTHHRHPRSNRNGHNRVARCPFVEPLEHRTLLSADGAMLAAPAAASARPVVTLTVPRPKAQEGVRTAYFQVTREGGNLALPLTVNLAITGKARNGVDYEQIAPTVVIPAGKTSAPIAIAPIDDAALERAEDATITLAAGNGYDIGQARQAWAWIFDNDGAVVQVSATNSQTTEGSSPGTITFTRTGLLNQAVKVGFATRGTATFGTDYSSFTNYVMIPAGQTKVTLDINAIDDLHAEPAETVVIRLANGWFQAGRIWKASVAIQDNDGADANNPSTIAAGTRFVTFRGPDSATEPGHVYRAVAQGGAIPTDLTKALNDLGFTGRDTGINISSNGRFIVLHTTRFGGDPNVPTVAVLDADNINSGRQLIAEGRLIVPADGNSAIANNGAVIIYASTEGPHEIDLWSAMFLDNQWKRTLLTGAEGWTYSHNIQPALSADGTRIVFAAGMSEANPEAIAVVAADGTGLQTVVTRANAPADSKADAYLNHPAFAPAGAIVFGSNFANVDQLWRWTPGSGLSLVSSAVNEMSPAVFADGRIASLWRDRAGNTNSVLELTLRYFDGSYQGTLLPGIDLPEIGLGVGTWT